MYLRTPSPPAINRSTKLSTTIVTSARSTGSSPIGRRGSTVTTRSRYRVLAALAVGAVRDRKQAELDVPGHSMPFFLKRGREEGPTHGFARDGSACVLRG